MRQHLPNGKHQGFVFIFAVVFLAVALILGIGLLGYASNTYVAARKSYHSLHALAMADAGVHYLFWKQRWSSTDSQSVTPVPKSQITYTCTFTGNDYANLITQQPHGERSFSTPTDRERFDAWLAQVNGTTQTVAGYQVISRGTYYGHTRVVRTVITQGGTATSGGNGGGGGGNPAIAKYAVFSDNNVVLAGNGSHKLGTVQGSLGTNGSVTLKGNGSVTGDTDADLHYSLPSVSGWLAYAQQHGQVLDSWDLTGDVTLTSSVIYVRGSINISGTVHIHGNATIIAEGGININGQDSLIADAGTTAPITLISFTSLDMNGQQSFQGVNLYVHNPERDTDPTAPPATLRLTGNGKPGLISIQGSAVADSVYIGGGGDVIYQAPSSPVTPPSGDWGMNTWELL